MKLRLASKKKKALEIRPILRSTLKYAPNEKSAEKSRMVIELYNEVFGKLSIKDKAKETLVRACAILEASRLKRNGGVYNRQPKTNRRFYPDRSHTKVEHLQAEAV